MAVSLPYVPTEITVHLGAPNASAQNVTIPFADYIKNVASSELYPTWPENALRANIIAQVSFALNRIYTEFYRARGYDFDITSLPAFDQTYVEGRDIFENISQLTDQLFNTYIRRNGAIEPLFAVYCDGVQTTCNGLSQWGSVGLAEYGLFTYEILQEFYGEDINLVYDAPILFNVPSYPGTVLQVGDSGDNVLTVQRRLNQISNNYPSISKISPVDGLFGEKTEASVRQFQSNFNLAVDGIVGKQTWYKLIEISNAVLRLNEIDSQGLSASGQGLVFFRPLQLGNAGPDVRLLQIIINTIATYSDVVPFVAEDGIFTESLDSAVKDFQLSVGLPATGISDFETFNLLYDAYEGAIATAVATFGSPTPLSYPGAPLRLGDTNEVVRVIQQYLLAVSRVNPEIPTFFAQGVYDTLFRNAVIAFQTYYGLNPDGVIGPITWAKIVEIYSDVRNSLLRSPGQYPGYDLSEEGPT